MKNIKLKKIRVCLIFVLVFCVEVCFLCFKSDFFIIDFFGNYFVVGKIICFGYLYLFEVLVFDNIFD